jgi:Skp family chaperone for outer membrane proteins
LKRIYLILLTAATLAAVVFSEAQAAQAAPGAELKIGFIDADRINRESVPAERATKKLARGIRAARAGTAPYRRVIELQGQLEKTA